ncbi:MAG: glycine cleavage system aminomethyltransferase GcvT [Candidatus Bipolaricaulia bacterium]
MALKRTPLHAAHQRLGARMIDFNGWDMPLHYGSILEEHRTVREHVGMFDVSHMGEIEIRNADALDLVQRLITNDADVSGSRALYSPICQEDGGTVDDLLVYRLTSERFLLVVNAGNTEKDFDWVKKQAEGFDVEIANRSTTYGQIALQGPEAEPFLSRIVTEDLSAIGYFRFREITILEGQEQALVSRTGYTGEDGFEIYGRPALIEAVWEMLRDIGVRPVGLGARDSLRFEAGIPLYGHELDEETTPIEAGLGWTVKLGKRVDFIGKAALERQLRQGVPQKLIGFEMLQPGVPRQGYPIEQAGEEVGTVSSGMKSPTLGRFLGMGYVNLPKLEPGDRIAIQIREESREARVIALPFYRGSVKAGSGKGKGSQAGTQEVPS